MEFSNKGIFVFALSLFTVGAMLGFLDAKFYYDGLLDQSMDQTNRCIDLTEKCAVQVSSRLITLGNYTVAPRVTPIAEKYPNT